MSRLEKSGPALAAASSSRSRPTVEKMGTLWVQLAVGLALCAATQIEHEAASVRFG